MNRIAVIEEYFEIYCELEEKEQKGFLQKLADDDPQLYADFKSLVTCEKDSTSFFNQFQEKIDYFVSDYYEPGTTIGNYKLEKIIGAGGMGYVYRSRRNDGMFNRTAAIKFLQNAENKEAISYFKKECYIVADLHHENITKLYDGGITQDGIPFFIMEYVDGPNIIHYGQEQKLSLIEKLELFVQLCEAVDYIHKKEIVHCDIKPNNVLINSLGHVKLMDFGISHYSSDDQDFCFTHSRQKALTLKYASPELKEGKEPGFASDIYQLGLLLFQLVTGEKDFNKLNLVLDTNNKDSFTCNDIYDIINICTQTSSYQRYPSASMLIKDIKNVIYNLKSKDEHKKIRRSIFQSLNAVAKYAASISL